MKRRPVIGLSMRLELNTNRFYLGRDYCEALEHFGAIPFHICLIPKKEFISETLKRLDGILLPGSDSDVDPAFYGEEPQPKLGNVVPEKDETDLLILREAEKLKIPVLGICFGMQVLNVSRGGTLVQDIETQIENSLKHEQGIPLERNSHLLTVDENSILTSLITTPLKVNSHHHQAIKEIGNNLKATAWAKDGVIECIEDTRNDRFALGVQWHPELSWKFDDLSKNIFQKFFEKCSEYNFERRI